MERMSETFLGKCKFKILGDVDMITDGMRTQIHVIRTSLVTVRHSAGRLELCPSRRLWPEPSIGFDVTVEWRGVSAGESFLSVVRWCLSWRVQWLYWRRSSVSNAIASQQQYSVATQRRSTDISELSITELSYRYRDLYDLLYHLRGSKTVFDLS